MYKYVATRQEKYADKIYKQKRESSYFIYYIRFNADFWNT